MIKRMGQGSRLTLLVVSMLLTAQATQSATLADYRGRLETAQTSINTIISVLEGDSPSQEVEEFLNNSAADLRKSIPRSEKVTFGASEIETANGWLHDDVDAFLRSSSASERILIMLSTREKLSGIMDRVAELERTTASDRSKDEDKRKLQEILDREEYHPPHEKEESLFQRWMREFFEWLYDLFPRPNISPVQTTGLGALSYVLQFLIYGVVIGLVGFLIYRFAPMLIGRFKRSTETEAADRVILGERIETSMSASSLFAEAEKLAKLGDIRGAIRKGYIALLCDLADRKVIGLARHKTNRDYLRDLRRRGPLYKQVNDATGSFERHWYGFRVPSEGDWEEFRICYQAAVREAH